MQLLIVLAFLFSLLITVLLVRFLWMVPNEIRELKYYLRKIYLENDEKNT